MNKRPKIEILYDDLASMAMIIYEGDVVYRGEYWLNGFDVADIFRKMGYTVTEEGCNLID